MLNSPIIAHHIPNFCGYLDNDLHFLSSMSQWNSWQTGWRRHNWLVDTWRLVTVLGNVCSGQEVSIRSPFVWVQNVVQIQLQLL